MPGGVYEENLNKFKGTDQAQGDRKPGVLLPKLLQLGKERKRRKEGVGVGRGGGWIRCSFFYYKKRDGWLGAVVPAGTRICHSIWPAKRKWKLSGLLV